MTEIWMCRLVVAVAGLVGTIFGFAAELPGESKPRSPMDRMVLPRLKAAHDDVARIQQTRGELPPVAGLTDYRAILHAHAEDSTHTGGTRPEMLADAKRAKVSVILLTNHHRPPTDFITDSWRGMRDGVLFIPGSEARGFLLYPAQSIMHRMQEPTESLIAAVRQDRGLIFLSHIEERPQHSMTGLSGLEIYNRHADAKKDLAGIVGLLLRMTDPTTLRELEEGVRLYPDELLASQLTYPDDYLAKWDRETATQRLTGVAANDCHHNTILIMKMVDENTVKIGTNVDADDKFRSFSALLRPGIRQLTKGRKPGDELARIDLDPYFRSFRNVSTHILAKELTESAIRFALQEGHAYVSHDWMCDPTGFSFRVEQPGSAVASMGDERTLAVGQSLVAEFPVSCRARLLRDGNVIAEMDSPTLRHQPTEPGVYRVEGWLTVDEESRPWIYSNPIYLTK